MYEEFCLMYCPTHSNSIKCLRCFVQSNTLFNQGSPLPPCSKSSLCTTRECFSNTNLITFNQVYGPSLLNSLFFVTSGFSRTDNKSLSNSSDGIVHFAKKNWIPFPSNPVCGKRSFSLGFMGRLESICHGTLGSHSP